uniref:Protein tyrosine phosphatase type IVA 3 n=1 Tax=Cyprinus carpio carpio TaxID=630221 RepID=A0A9J7ZVE5_CYPCA
MSAFVCDISRVCCHFHMASQGSLDWFRAKAVIPDSNCSPSAVPSRALGIILSGTQPVTKDLKKYGATTVVRVCEITYDKSPLEKDGITVMDWPFDDGAPPPTKIVDDWLSLLKNKFCEEPGCCVAVHCVAGLGRAPVLVALALIESGMKYEDAIQLIRQKRRGAINSKQLTYLEKYRPKQRLRFKDPHNHKSKCCLM